LITDKQGDDSVEITVRVPKHLARHVEDIAKKLGLSREQVVVSCLGVSATDEYLSQLRELASDLEHVKGEEAGR
jgi:hypothetical protein